MYRYACVYSRVSPDGITRVMWAMTGTLHKIGKHPTQGSQCYVMLTGPKDCHSLNQSPRLLGR